MDHSRVTAALNGERMLAFALLGTASALAFTAWIGVDVSTQLWLAGTLIVFLIGARRYCGSGWLRLLYLGVIVFLMMRYLFWRTFSTLGWHDPFSFAGMLLLYGAEVYAVGLGLLSVVVTLRPIDRKPAPWPDDSRVLPTVDVLIPTYDEDPALVETTLIAARNMEYPPDKLRIHLLDDGGTTQKCTDSDPARAAAARARQAALMALCTELGANYLTRARNEGAKAGNLNAGLARTDADLVVVFDADHVPTVDFLKKTVGHFLLDTDLFLVQTPHFLINPDPVERNLEVFSRMPAENEMFFRVTQRGLDFWNAAFFAGSAAVLRRRCLVEVGGLAGVSLTEDAETALELHARGYRSRYVSEPLVSGLAPESFDGFVRQRMRWATGMLQILLLKNPLRRQGLSVWQKLCYFTSCLYWLFPFARVVFLVAPLLFLLFGLHIYNASVAEIFAYTVPHYWASLRMASYQYGKVRWPFASTLYELLQSLFSLQALLAVLRNPRSPTFAVTPKREHHADDFVSPLAQPFYLMFALLLVGAAAGVWRYVMVPADQHMVLVVGFWHGINLLLMVAALGVIAELRQRRTEPRLPANLAGTLTIGGTVHACTIDDLSLSGARVSLQTPLALADGARGVLDVEGATRNSVLPIRVAQSLGTRIGIAFVRDALAERQEIVRLVRGDSARWRAIWDRHDPPIGALGSLVKLVSAGIPQLRRHGRHLAALLMTRLPGRARAGTPATAADRRERAQVTPEAANATAKAAAA
jgi:cellulose synthase (UDP-forming)